MTISPQEIPLSALSMFLFQRQEFFKNYLARVPTTPCDERTMEMRDEALSNASAQDMVTSGYQVSDLDDFEFFWETDQLDVDADLIPGIDTPVSPTAFDLHLGDGRYSRKLHSARQRRWAEELSCKNSCLRETDTTSCNAGKPFFWNKK